MSELKTLKDFEPKDTDCVSRKELRREAIKYIKFLDEELKRIMPNEQMAVARIFARQEMLLHFCNISEEDLIQVCGMNVETDKKLKRNEFELRVKRNEFELREN